MTHEPLYCRVDGLVSADMDGERVMMSPEQGAYFGLAGIGGTIWDMLSEPCRLSEIQARVMAGHAVDAETCRADIVAFVTDLERNGLVRASPPMPG